MPSMASMILRASREAARAARSAASAASRCAAALEAAAAADQARSGSGGAAASQPLMRGPFVAAACARIPRKRLSLRSGHSPVAAPPSGSASSSTNGYGCGGGSTVVTSPTFDMAKAPPFPAKGRSKFEADEKDLESDEALFALYERWCKVFNQERSRNEMARRFGKFKKSVLRVEQNKKAGESYTLEINKFADGKLFELCSCKDSSKNFVQFAERMPSNMMIYARPPDFTCSRRSPWDTTAEIPNQSA